MACKLIPALGPTNPHTATSEKGQLDIASPTTGASQAEVKDFGSHFQGFGVYGLVANVMDEQCRVSPTLSCQS